MAPRIPEGYVFVPRQSGVNVALQLIDAADAIGADRLKVRSTLNGYFVEKAVAEKYVETVGDEAGDIVEPTSSGSINGPVTEKEILAHFEDNLIDDRAEEEADDEDDESEDESTEDESTGDDESTEDDEPAPLGVTAENTNTEIDDYAAKLDPPVDVSKAKNKAEKIEILEHARTAPKTDDAA